MTIKNVFHEIAERMDDLAGESCYGISIYKDLREARLQELRRAQHWVVELKETILARIEEILAEDERSHQEWDGLRRILGMKLGEIAEERGAMIAELQNILGKET